MARGGDNRGGRQVPRRPAAVSGPGALSRRTDGGPGSDTQPIRVPTGGDYGDAKRLEAQQKGAPLPDNTPSPPSPSGAGSRLSATGPTGGDVFGPTQRPGESPLAGVPLGGQTPTDPDTIIRLLYAAFPHPQLLKLIRRR